MNDKIYEVNKVCNNIWAITEVNSVIVYLVVGKEKALLIDTGYGYGDLKKIVREITDLPLIVVVTHGHIDHIAGNYQFSDVWISDDDRKVMNEHFYEQREGNLNYRFKKMPHLKEIINPNEYLCKSLENTTFHSLKNNMEIDLGGKKVKVIDIKGHSKGSVVFYDEENACLFTGDSVSLHNIWMFQDDSLTLLEYKNSLINLKSQLINKDIKIFPAHGEILLEYEVIDDLIACTEEILSGKSIYSDEDFEMFGAKGKKHYYKSVSIIYGDRQLTIEK